MDIMDHVCYICGEPIDIHSELTIRVDVYGEAYYAALFCIKQRLIAEIKSDIARDIWADNHA